MPVDKLWITCAAVYYKAQLIAVLVAACVITVEHSALFQSYPQAFVSLWIT